MANLKTTIIAGNLSFTGTGRAVDVGTNVTSLVVPGALDLASLSGDVILSRSGTTGAVQALAIAANKFAARGSSGGLAAKTITDFGLSLMDDADAAAARTTLGLVIGTNVQAQSANLNTFAGIAPSANVQTLLGAANFSAMRTSLGLVVGTDVQAHSAALDVLAGKSLSGTGNIALVSYVDGAIASAVTGLQEIKGSLNCSANPNYPAASSGDTYRVSVAGRIGGLSGPLVSVGDMVIAFSDNAGGTHAEVGSSWAIGESNIQGITSTGTALITASDAAAARDALLLGALATVTPGDGVVSALEEEPNTAGGIVLYDGTAPAIQRAFRTLNNEEPVLYTDGGIKLGAQNTWVSLPAPDEAKIGASVVFYGPDNDTGQNGFYSDDGNIIIWPDGTTIDYFPLPSGARATAQLDEAGYWRVALLQGGRTNLGNLSAGEIGINPDNGEYQYCQLGTGDYIFYPNGSGSEGKRITVCIQYSGGCTLDFSSIQNASDSLVSFPKTLTAWRSYRFGWLYTGGVWTLEFLKGGYVEGVD